MHMGDDIPEGPIVHPVGTLHREDGECGLPQILRQPRVIPRIELLQAFDMRAVIHKLAMPAVRLVTIQVERGNLQLRNLEPVLAVIRAR
jgi:hypothetical protein